MTAPLTNAARLACLIVVLLVAATPMLGSDYLIDVVTEILIFALFALSLNVIIGYSGNVSFGHAAYFAIGGYVNAILLTTHGWPLIPAFVAGVVFATLTAAVVAYFCTRLTDIYFAMLTLAFSMLVWAIAFKWRSVTNGDDGFVGVTVPAFIEDRTAFFYFTLAVVAVS
ncbi:MAG: branched-chain amino acid ABC transporter permease, partial [Alphaproteobacteria bacterium]